jgi:hypothetical protein
MSLVVGDEPVAYSLRDLICHVTRHHDVQLCRLDETFALCNNHTFQLIWLCMDIPATQDTLSITTSIR